MRGKAIHKGYTIQATTPYRSTCRLPRPCSRTIRSRCESFRTLDRRTGRGQRHLGTPVRQGPGAWQGCECIVANAMISGWQFGRRVPLAEAARPSIGETYIFNGADPSAIQLSGRRAHRRFGWFDTTARDIERNSALQLDRNIRYYSRCASVRSGPTTRITGYLSVIKNNYIGERRLNTSVQGGVPQCHEPRPVRGAQYHAVGRGLRSGRDVEFSQLRAPRPASGPLRFLGGDRPTGIRRVIRVPLGARRVECRMIGSRERPAVFEPFPSGLASG